MAKGISLNNPCNVEADSDVFEGEIVPSSDSTFKQFSSAEYGIRAGCKVFLTYQRKYNIKTIADLITKWAPPIENNTAAYITDVANRVGVVSSAEIDLTDIIILTRFITAVIHHEEGEQPYSSDLILKAANEALN